ncbi:class I SAM-dependent methyltransferase [Thiomonas sp.]
MFGPSYKDDDMVEVCGRKFHGFARAEIHPVISSLICEHPRGKVLDFPAGAGALAWKLHNEGFEVVSADKVIGNFENPELQIIEADLNQIFPFDDNSFDHACFVEGPEHVENVYHCFREFSRVLKPGGRLFLSMPNYSNLQNRLRDLMYGASEPMVGFDALNHDYDDSNRYMIHINRLSYPMLRMALEFAGFQVIDIRKDKTKKKQRLLWPLAALIYGLTKARGERGRNKYWLHENNSPNVLMGGNTIILCAEKRAVHLKPPSITPASKKT